MAKITDIKKRNRYIRIRTLMLKKGITAGDIGRILGLTRQAINYAIIGHVKSPHTRVCIAEALGVPYEKLWGKDKERAA